jgi:hydrogenase-4 component E
VTGFEDALLLVLDALAIALVGLGRLVSSIRLVTVQAFALAVLVAVFHGGAAPVHAAVIAAVVAGVRGVLIPVLLSRLARSGATREPAPLLGYGTSLLLAGVLMGVAMGVAAGLPAPRSASSDLLVPSALGNVLLGFLLIASRRKALTQVLGYLVMETGIFLAGLPLVDAMPIALELGVFLDVFLGVFVMGVMVHHMGRVLEHTDTDELDALRES